MEKTLTGFDRGVHYHRQEGVVVVHTRRLSVTKQETLWKNYMAPENGTLPTLVGAALVFFMQAGFAMVETG